MMNTLTQVWVFSIALCSVILVSSFKMAGRLGLFMGFVLSLILIYLLLHKGLKLFLDQSQAELQKGSDPTGFNQLLQLHKSKYVIEKYFLHYTTQNSHPLVWQNFKNELHLVLNKSMVERLELDEKILLAHLMLSHGSQHSKLRRRFFSIIYLALLPISSVLTPLFNTLAELFKLKNQILNADLMALKNSDSKTATKIIDFSLFLRKLHYLSFHHIEYLRGENYFSILSNSSPHSFKLNLAPPLDLRLKKLNSDLSFNKK